MLALLCQKYKTEHREGLQYGQFCASLQLRGRSASSMS